MIMLSAIGPLQAQSFERLYGAYLLKPFQGIRREIVLLYVFREVFDEGGVKFLEFFLACFLGHSWFLVDTTGTIERSEILQGLQHHSNVE